MNNNICLFSWWHFLSGASRALAPRTPLQAVSANLPTWSPRPPGLETEG